MGSKVLLVDDDEKLRKLVTEYLEGYGFQVNTLPDGLLVQRTIHQESPDIVARGEDADRIVGLELGADDYLPKPFNPRELLARMKAVIRRISFEDRGVHGERELTSQQMQRQLRAIFSADVKDYSRLMAEDEMWTIYTLNAYRDLVASRVQSHLGRVVDSPGDNILAEFGSVLNAVQCAVEIQKELTVKNADLPDQRKMEFRIGINLGDVVFEKGKIYGDGVNIAARIERLAQAGGICISGTVYDQVENRLPFSYEYLGEKSVKNITKPIRVYQVRTDLETPRSRGTSGQ
jgi:class 3 adenylate cyclase